VERQPDGNHGDRQTDAGHAGNGEGDRGGDDVIDLDSRVVSELAHEKEQRDELRAGEQQRCGDVVDAVGERRQQRDDHQHEVGYDQRHIGHAVIGEHNGIDRREHGDQQRHGVDDLKPAPHRPRIARRAPFDECGERAETGQCQGAALGHVPII
jgi:hypothetical protein